MNTLTTRHTIIILVAITAVLACAVYLIQHSYRINGKEPSNSVPHDHDLQDPVRLALKQSEGLVAFHGMVADENGVGISGANVTIYVRSYLPDSKSGYHTLVTDENGRFDVVNMYGNSLGIQQVSHPDYIAPAMPDRQPRVFRYGKNQTFTPDRNNPVVYHLCKRRNDVQPLVRFSRQAKWSDMNAELLITFEDAIPFRKTVADSHPYDCKIIVTRSEQASGSKFDWSIRVESASGGVQERTIEHRSFEIPSDGYLTTFEYQMPMTLGAEWRDRVEIPLMVRWRNGEVYGNVTLGVQAPGSGPYDGWVEFSGVFSPTGSRYLEPSYVLDSPHAIRDAVNRTLRVEKGVEGRY